MELSWRWAWAVDSIIKRRHDMNRFARSLTILAVAIGSMAFISVSDINADADGNQDGCYKCREGGLCTNGNLGYSFCPDFQPCGEPDCAVV